MTNCQAPNQSLTHMVTIHPTELHNQETSKQVSMIEAKEHLSWKNEG